MTQYGESALMLAARPGHTAVVRRLIAAGSNVNLRGEGEEGWTALHMAASSGHLGVVNELLRAGANANALNDVRAPARRVRMRVMRDCVVCVCVYVYACLYVCACA